MLPTKSSIFPRPRRPSRSAGRRLAALVCVLGAAPLIAATAPELPPLTTASGNPRLPGKFVWADLVTDNVPVAMKFYSELLGWTFRDYGGYLIAANDDRPLAGLFQRARPKDHPEAQPRWFGYLSVASIQRAEQAATRSGGRVLAAPARIPKRGEQAIFADPEGALFGVVKSAGGDPEDFLAEPGDWIWVQLLSRDAGKAAQFYRKVGGYDIIANTTANRQSDIVLASKGYARATVRTISQRQNQVRPAWLLFVRVKDVTASVTRTKALGGKVLLAPKPQLFDGKVAVVADPTGAPLGLMEWSASLMNGAK